MRPSQGPVEKAEPGLPASVTSATFNNDLGRISAFLEDTKLRGNVVGKQPCGDLSNFRAICANVRGFRQGCGELAQTAVSVSAHLISVCETHLFGDCIDPLIPKGYVVGSRKDRSNHGGGVLLLVYESLLFTTYDCRAFYKKGVSEIVA